MDILALTGNLQGEVPPELCSFQDLYRVSLAALCQQSTGYGPAYLGASGG